MNVICLKPMDTKPQPTHQAKAYNLEETLRFLFYFVWLWLNIFFSGNRIFVGNRHCIFYKLLKIINNMDTTGSQA